MDRILADYRAIIEPGVTHWNHPGFLAYFSSTSSSAGVVAEALAAGLNVNAMLWRTGPAATELELLVCDWLRQMVGLPDASPWAHQRHRLRWAPSWRSPRHATIGATRRSGELGNGRSPRVAAARRSTPAIRRTRPSTRR